jgi:hypothetical protein
MMAGVLTVPGLALSKVISEGVFVRPVKATMDSARAAAGASRAATPSRSDARSFFTSRFLGG